MRRWAWGMLAVAIIATGALYADAISDAILQHASSGPHRGAAGLEDVQDLRTQIAGIVGVAVLLIGSFGMMLYARGVAELRGEIHTSNAELRGEIHLLTEKIETQEMRVDRVEGGLGVLSTQHLDALNRYTHALSEAGRVNAEVMQHLNVRRNG